MWRVMSDTRLGSPSSSSESATSEAASKNSGSDRYSAATPASSSMFSTRPRASMLPSARSSLRYPVRSATAEVSSPGPSGPSASGRRRRRPRGPGRPADQATRPPRGRHRRPRPPPAVARPSGSATRRASRARSARALEALPVIPASSARPTASPKDTPVELSPPGQPGHRRLAHAPLGHVDDAPPAHLVVRVDQDPQVGQDVFHLAAVVEPGAAHHLVGHLVADHRLFEGAALRVGPVEDGHVAPPDALLPVEPADLARPPTPPRRARPRPGSG